MTVFTAGVASAYGNSVTFRGQGFIADGFGGYDVQSELCGVANGADADGPYLLWVLTATKSAHADITGPWGTAEMVKSGSGTFKYVSGWADPDALVALPVSATYDGTTKNVQLVVSHGCRPYSHGAWCSPGFWKNAEDAAWALIGTSPTETFNTTVVPDFYATASSEDPTLQTVLGTPGANTYGAADAPYGLNAYNATGAYLTDNIPGYRFDPAFVGDDDSQTCPVDHHGNLKPTS